MTKEATRAIKDLKNARKAKEERANQRVSFHRSSLNLSWQKAARKNNRRLSGGSTQSTESGEISERDTYRRSHSPVNRITKKPEQKDIDLDVQEAICKEVNSARLSRYEIVEIMYKDTFEDVAKGKLLILGRRTELINRIHG
jgi:RNA polymerase-associated protein RTF1